MESDDDPCLLRCGESPFEEVSNIFPHILFNIGAILAGWRRILNISIVERTYGKAPEVPDEILNDEWYNTLPNGLSDHKIVVEARDSGHPKVVAYEQVCLGILKWLEQYGDLVGLEEP